MKPKIDPKSLVLGLMIGCVALYSIAASTTDKADEVLRVRKLVIVDEKGTERIVVAASLPDPQVMGKRAHRRSPATGIQLNDASGNERGGIAMLADGSFVVGIDDERGRERAHMFFIPTRGVGLLLQGPDGREHISLSIPAEGASAGKTGLEITDQAGRATVNLPSTK